MTLRSVRSREISLITSIADLLTGRAQTFRMNYQGLKELVQERKYYGEINCTFHT